MRKTYRIQGKELGLEDAQAFINQYSREMRQNRTRYVEMLSCIPQGTHVLDYGCGWGVFSQMLVEHGCRVDGVDIDPDAIAVAQDMIQENDLLSFELRDISDIADEIYDVVVSSAVLEHTHNPGNYVKQCNRVLKIGGHLVITVPNIMNLRFFLFMLSNRHRSKYHQISDEIKEHYDKAHHHIQAWDPKTFCRFLCSLGFEYVAHAFLGPVTLPRRYWRTNIPRVRNLSYTMMFQVKKYKYVDISPYE